MPLWRQAWRSFQGFKENRRERLCILRCFGLALYRFTRANQTQSIKLCSIEFGFRTQSNTIRWIEFDWVQFDLFDWIRFVRKSNSLKAWCSISFDCRTQSNSIRVRLSSIFERSICYAGWYSAVICRKRSALTCNFTHSSFNRLKDHGDSSSRLLERRIW